MSHHFNCPYKFNNKEFEEGSIVRKFNVQSNDLFILGTDGLFDNFSLVIITYLSNLIL